MLDPVSWQDAIRHVYRNFVVAVKKTTSVGMDAHTPIPSLTALLPLQALPITLNQPFGCALHFIQMVNIRF